MSEASHHSGPLLPEASDKEFDHFIELVKGKYFCSKVVNWNQ
jgi:hypothetical protein